MLCAFRGDENNTDWKERASGVLHPTFSYDRVLAIPYDNRLADAITVSCGFILIASLALLPSVMMICFQEHGVSIGEPCS